MHAEGSGHDAGAWQDRPIKKPAASDDPQLLVAIILAVANSDGDRT